MITATDVAEADRVWHEFDGLAALTNAEHPWLTPGAATLDAPDR